MLLLLAREAATRHIFRDEIAVVGEVDDLPPFVPGMTRQQATGSRYGRLTFSTLIDRVVGGIFTFARLVLTDDNDPPEDNKRRRRTGPIDWLVQAGGTLGISAYLAGRPADGFDHAYSAYEYARALEDSDKGLKAEWTRCTHPGGPTGQPTPKETWDAATGIRLHGYPGAVPAVRSLLGLNLWYDPDAGELRAMKGDGSIWAVQLTRVGGGG